MNPRDFLAKRKIHLFFVGAFLFVLVFNIAIGFTASETFMGATWRGVSQIRPMEYLMFALFWSACALHRPKDDRDSPLISLDLSGPNDLK